MSGEQHPFNSDPALMRPKGVKGTADDPALQDPAFLEIVQHITVVNNVWAWPARAVAILPRLELPHFIPMQGGRQPPTYEH